MFMYIEILGCTKAPQGRVWFDVKFHEGILHNKIFKHVDSVVIAGLITGVKIPVSQLNLHTWVHEVTLKNLSDLPDTVTFLTELRDAVR